MFISTLQYYISNGHMHFDADFSIVKEQFADVGTCAGVPSLL